MAARNSRNGKAPMMCSNFQVTDHGDDSPVPPQRLPENCVNKIEKLSPLKRELSAPSYTAKVLNNMDLSSTPPAARSSGNPSMDFETCRRQVDLLELHVARRHKELHGEIQYVKGRLSSVETEYHRLAHNNQQMWGVLNHMSGVVNQNQAQQEFLARRRSSIATGVSTQMSNLSMDQTGSMRSMRIPETNPSIQNVLQQSSHRPGPLVLSEPRSSQHEMQSQHNIIPSNESLANRNAESCPHIKSSNSSVAATQGSSPSRRNHNISVPPPTTIQPGTNHAGFPRNMSCGAKPIFQKCCMRQTIPSIKLPSTPFGGLARNLPFAPPPRSQHMMAQMRDAVASMMVNRTVSLGLQSRNVPKTNIAPVAPVVQPKITKAKSNDVTQITPSPSCTPTSSSHQGKDGSAASSGNYGSGSSTAATPAHNTQHRRRKDTGPLVGLNPPAGVRMASLGAVRKLRNPSTGRSTIQLAAKKLAELRSDSRERSSDPCRKQGKPASPAQTPPKVTPPQHGVLPGGTICTKLKVEKMKPNLNDDDCIHVTAQLIRDNLDESDNGVGNRGTIRSYLRNLMVQP